MRASSRFVIGGIVALGGSLGAARATAQDRPDFSGTWRAGAVIPGRVLDPAKPGATGTSKSGLTITQRGAQLLLTDGRLTETYALDGSASTCEIHVSGKVTPVSCRARWDGQRLVMQYQVPLVFETRDFTRTMSIDGHGTLILESSSSGKSGTDHRVQRYARQGSIS